MNKLDFFLKAMKAEEYRRRAWVTSAFSLIREGPDDWKKNPYAYRIVQTPVGHFFVDPENGNQLSPIDEFVAGQPPFLIKDKIRIGIKHDVPNNFRQVKSSSEEFDTDTTYGNLLFNFVCIIYPFGKKIPYLTGRVSPSQIEKLIIKRLKDTPESDDLRDKDGEVPYQDQAIYVDEYLKYCNAAFYLAGFTQLCVPAASPKSMTAAPGIVELKAKLIEENKERLSDPAVIAKIAAELVAYDREYLKGDASEGFLINDKSFNVVRSKLFGMQGGDAGLGDGDVVEFIPNSLSQGMDPKHFPAANNSLRAGSFNRGSETQLGGEAVKWLLRASSNMAVTVQDCGSRLGNTIDVNGTNYEWLVGFHVLADGGTEFVPDSDSAKSYMGKHLVVRSPMFCKLENNDYCVTCVGARLAENPTALSAAVAQYGSAMMQIFMSKMHQSALQLAKMDYNTAIT